MASGDLRNQFYLPPELWLLILTHAAEHQDPLQPYYEPFHSAGCAISSETSVDAVSLKNRHALGLVCKQWRGLIVKQLYQDIRVGRRGAALLATLQRKETHEGHQYGRLVRRMVLPYSSTETRTNHALPALDILRACPQLEVLIRPPTVAWLQLPQFDFTTESPSFPNLKRLDWWHHDYASRSGGINNLGDVLRNAPNLEYLSICDDGRSVPARQKCMQLSHLKVLRVQRVMPMFAQRVCLWDMPSLTHLILGNPYPAASKYLFCGALGPRLRSIELGLHMSFLLRDEVGMIMASCPQLIEINFYALFTAPCRYTRTHTSLQRVGLHLHENLSLACDDHYDSKAREMVEGHLNAFPKDMFPSLADFVMYGEEWIAMLKHPNSPSIEDLIRSQGRSMVVI
ncbi:hypothetical protein BC834DRAFT_815790 [Gloeopeniophorella convolvens]|nr:hypothetical protein BC834DRAFT_815790 [Gloeopeniophorella convolvens]